MWSVLDVAKRYLCIRYLYVSSAEQIFRICTPTKPCKTD